MHKQDKTLLLYIHVPKTAGTTMKMILEWLYPWHQIFWAKSADYVQAKTKKLTETQLENISIIAGHSPFGMHNYFPHGQYQYFTFLREPISRFISQYNFLRRSPGHRLYPYIRDKGFGLKDFLDNGVFRNFNIQTHWLTGIDKAYFREGNQSQEVVNKAINNIERDFAFVGLNDHFDEGLILLKRLFGWSTPFYAKKNVTSSKDKTAEFDQELIDQIKEANQMDLQVYEYCQQQFFNKIAQERDDQFEEELARLRNLNRKIGTLKPYRLKLLKDSVLKGFQTTMKGGTEAVDVFP